MWKIIPKLSSNTLLICSSELQCQNSSNIDPDLYDKFEWYGYVKMLVFRTIYDKL